MTDAQTKAREFSEAFFARGGDAMSAKTFVDLVTDIDPRAKVRGSDTWLEVKFTDGSMWEYKVGMEFSK